MALTPSTMLPLGTPAPDFDLLEPSSGRKRTLAEFSSHPALVVAFICNHCPFVKHLRAALAQFGRDCASRGAAFVAISANDVAHYPEDAPQKMVDEARTAGWAFPYLYDETQALARAYRAACTPDFFLFDADRKLVYRGQFDDSRPGNGKPITGADLRDALDAVLTRRPVASKQIPSIGCNIKWKPGQEPDYSK